MPIKPLYQKLYAIRHLIAKAAQHVYDQWEPDEEGIDCEYGGGGICDQVARGIEDTIRDHVKEDDLEVVEGGQPGDDHAWVLVFNDEEAYDVDIPPDVYETGGGFSWKKTHGVTIRDTDVVISPVDRKRIHPSDYD